MKLFRTKSEVPHQDTELKRCLNSFDLILLGIGAIIGAGIFVLTGIAAATKAGPAVVLSYALAGLACSFAALCYAELAASVGGAGSAYNYAYVGIGELIAWIIGWDLILEYGVSVGAVAIGWSGYVNDALNVFGLQIPPILLKTPSEGGFINLAAVFIVLFLSCIVAIGVKLSARVNAVIVVIKLLTITLFISVAIFNVHFSNWVPFMPFGWKGMVEGASLVFFAFIGFDAVSTAAEECVNPQRNMTIGIIGSLAICTTIYMVVAALLTGIVPYSTLNVKSPVAHAILAIGHESISGFIALGAIAGLTSVMLIFIYGFSRILYSMSRDGLLPKVFSEVHHKTHTPVKTILFCGVMMSLMAGFFSMHTVAELVNIGTLAAFVIVCISVLILRKTKPDLHRPFKTPLFPAVPILGIISCSYLMLNLPWVTWLRFVIWMALGLIVYFCYSYKNSRIHQS